MTKNKRSTIQLCHLTHSKHATSSTFYTKLMCSFNNSLGEWSEVEIPGPPSLSIKSPLSTFDITYYRFLPPELLRSTSSMKRSPSSSSNRDLGLTPPPLWPRPPLALVQRPPLLSRPLLPLPPFPRPRPPTLSSCSLSTRFNQYVHINDQLRRTHIRINLHRPLLNTPSDSISYWYKARGTIQDTKYPSITIMVRRSNQLYGTSPCRWCRLVPRPHPQIQGQCRSRAWITLNHEHSQRRLSISYSIFIKMPSVQTTLMC